MKRLTMLLVLSCNFYVMYAQNNKHYAPNYIPVLNKNGRYVIKSDTINITSGNEYDYIMWFKGGLAQARKNNKSGFIDTTGSEIVPLKYDNVHDFVEGLAQVEVGKKHGFVNRRGMEIIPLKYDYASDFHNGFAVVCTNKKYGFINREGKEIVPLKYDMAEDFYEGLAGVAISRKWGYIDTNGKQVTPIKYDVTQHFEKGLAWVNIDGQNFTFIDRAGKEHATYHSYKEFHNGFASVLTGEGWGLIDSLGNVIIPANISKFQYLNQFQEGLAVVFMSTNEKGTSASKVPQHNYITKYGFVDMKGNTVIPVKYDGVIRYGQDLGYEGFHDGLAGVCKGNAWGFINTIGKEVIPCQYQQVDTFSNGLAKVEKNGKWGYINKSGRIVVPINYDYIGTFHNSFAKVSLNNKSGIIDANGKLLIPLKYDLIWDSEAYSGTDIFYAKLSDKDFYVDLNGKEYKD